jgi:hypothetical protein
MNRLFLESKAELDAVTRTTAPVKRMVEERIPGRKMGTGFCCYSLEGKRIPGFTGMKL